MSQPYVAIDSSPDGAVFQYIPMNSANKPISAIVHLRSGQFVIQKIAAVQAWTSHGYPAGLLYGPQGTDGRLTPFIVGWQHPELGEIVAVSLSGGMS